MREGEAPRIAEVRVDPRDETKVLVVLSDGRRFRLEAGRLGELRLTAGMHVDEDLETRLEGEEERSAARVRALRFLETRERSRAEVSERLRRFGYADPLLGETLAWLLSLGYLDDRRFAEWFVRAHARSAWGPRRFREELRRKGVTKAIIEETLASLEATGGEAETELDALADLVGRRFGRELARDRERAERRISGYLTRRGHDWESIRRVLARLPAHETTSEEVDDGPPVP